MRGSEKRRYRVRGDIEDERQTVRVERSGRREGVRGEER